VKNFWNVEWDRFVGQININADAAAAGDIPKDFIKTHDIDFARQVGFSRIAPHHVVLPAGCRTSSPHAESLEEEFVYVIKGRPHLWLNGYMYQLEAGHAVGFPSGTGIAHTFINNTSDAVELLVVGERTKKDNLCSFPVNPELQKDCPIWWSNPPVHALGLHKGLPGKLSTRELGADQPSCLVQCFEQPRGKGFHYPGDNETFGEGFRISDKIGLKALGIWFESLPSGRRSAFPHAHTHEEEFVFVVKGTLTVWMNGFAKTVHAGGYAAFPSGTGIAHVLINDSSEVVNYICIGETQNFKDEKISYPKNELRMQECLRKGWAWTAVPSQPTSNAHERSKRWNQEHLSFELCSDDHAPSILAIYQASPQYFLDVEGKLPDLESVRKDLADSPAARSEKYFKQFLLVKLNDAPIAVVDLHVHHPKEKTCYLGLLVLHADHSSKGWGRKIFSLIEDYVVRALGCEMIRLGVSDANACSGFWLKCGFALSGHEFEHAGVAKTTLVREFQKAAKASI